MLTDRIATHLAEIAAAQDKIERHRDAIRVELLVHRIDQGRTQRDLARHLCIKSLGHMSELEKGTRNWTPTNARAAAIFLNNQDATAPKLAAVAGLEISVPFDLFSDLTDYAFELRGEWAWKQNERAGNAKQYTQLHATAALALELRNKHAPVPNTKISNAGTKTN